MLEQVQIVSQPPNLLEKIRDLVAHAESLHEDDDWTLNVDQMVFMIQHHNQIEDAFDRDDMDTLRTLAASQEFLTIFGDMSFDESYDRYESNFLVST